MADGRARARIREALIGALALIAIGCHSPSAVRRAESLLARGDALAARQVLIEDGDTAALIALAELESRLFPHHRAQGIAALADDDPIGAEESFAQALAIVPDHPEVTALFARARELAARRREATDTMLRATAVGDWRRALVAAVELPPRHLDRLPPELGVSNADRVVPELRRRLFDRLAIEIAEADRAGDLPALRSWVREAEAALLLRGVGEQDEDPTLVARFRDWRALEDGRRSARAYLREAEAGLRGGEQLRAWRKLRLALASNPSDARAAEAEAGLRRSFRERLRIAIDRAARDCDLEAARLALSWDDELDEEWPTEAPVSRAELVAWVVAEHAARARALESDGLPGHALLEWLAARRAGGGDEVSRSLDRAVARLARVPRLQLSPTHRAAGRIPAERLEVVIGPIRVRERVARGTLEESIGWVRTGVRRTPHPGRASDARRFGRVLRETLELRDEWLCMSPTRAGLGERRLRFQLSELGRLARRIERCDATEERGVWHEQQLELVHEEREIVVERTLLLMRDGALVGRSTLGAEGRVDGRLPRAAGEATPAPGAGASDGVSPHSVSTHDDVTPHGEGASGIAPGEIPSRVVPLATGVAAGERLRLRLEAECRLRTREHLADLRRREVDRLEQVALRHEAEGDRTGAIERLVVAWLQASPEDRSARLRRSTLLARWADLPDLPPELGADLVGVDPSR